MKKLIGICGMVLAMGCIVPVCAAEEGGRTFTFGKNNARLYHVVYTTPIFDGTGYASQSHLKYTPYQGGFSITSRPDRGDYYRIVREMP